MAVDYDWTSKKPPTYCRPHGKRIVGFINGVGLCQDCIPKGYDMVQVTDDTFQQEVLSSDIPVLVDFYADWCPPCRMAEPYIEELAGEYGDRVKFAKVNVDTSSKYAVENGVRGIPNFIVFKGGKRMTQFVGWHDKSAEEIRAALETALASN